MIIQKPMVDIFFRAENLTNIKLGLYIDTVGNWIHPLLRYEK